MTDLLKTLPDYLGSLALLAVLALAYGHLHRNLVRPKLGHGVLGLCFGLAAMAEMHMPIEPMPGLIIDMRNAPIILCAAFLGLRATLICLALAVATRLQIGGVGMTAGVLAMTTAAMAGLLWARLTARAAHRSIWHMLGLSAMGSAHLSAAFVLPDPAFTWFVTYAVAPIVVLNLVSITLVACLIEAEHVKIAKENRLLAAAVVDPDHGVMTKAALLREMHLKIASGAMVRPAGALHIKLQNMPRLQSILPAQWSARLLGLVQMRVRDVLPEGTMICAQGQSTLVIPLSGAQMRDEDQTCVDINRAISEDVFRLPIGVGLPLRVQTAWVPAPVAAPLDKVLDGPKPLVRKSPVTLDAAGAKARSAKPADLHNRPLQGEAAETMDMLFGTAHDLMRAA